MKVDGEGGFELAALILQRHSGSMELVHTLRKGSFPVASPAYSLRSSQLIMIT